jgi:hypothetical protein
LAAAVVLAAHHLVVQVGVVGVADHEALALADDAPAADPGVEHPVGAAPAQHLHLEPRDLVGQLEQPRRGGKQRRGEVGGQAEGVDVHAVAIDQVGHLLDVFAGEEVRLVADHVVDPGVDGQVEQVVSVGQLHSVLGQADAGGDRRPPRAVVPGQQHSVAALAGVVVVDLQGKCRLATVHRSIIEFKQGAATRRPGGIRGHGQPA